MAQNEDGAAKTPGDNGDGGTKTDKTFTQAEVDKLVKDRLERDRKKYVDYEDLKAAKAELDKIKTENMTEAEKLKAELEAVKTAKAEAEAKVKASERKSTVTSLLLKAGISINLADRIKGDTEEEIQADIDSLKEIVKTTTSGAGGSFPPSGGGKGDEKNADLGVKLAEARAKVAAQATKSSDMFFKKPI